MKHMQVNPSSGFHVLASTSQSEAATMSIEKNGSEGGPNNKHDADQWLYVISGVGQAIIQGQRVHLAPGSLLLICAGERHEIRNTGRARLRTLNFYAPPEF